MNANDLPASVTSAQDDAEPLSPLLNAPARIAAALPVIQGALIGELLALTDNGKTPLVRFDLTPAGTAVPARSTIDLHGTHIGRQVVLMFERGEVDRPIVMGVLQGTAGWPDEERPKQVEITADGERMQVSAKEQLVLRCGKASITLTKAGKVLIEGSYLLSRSTGVNRIKGGSVQLN